MSNIAKTISGILNSVGAAYELALQIVDDDLCNDIMNIIEVCNNGIIEAIKTHLGTDRNNVTINIGDKVRWYDPEEEYRNLDRVWKVKKIDGNIVLIADSYSEAEVGPKELEIIQ